MSQGDGKKYSVEEQVEFLNIDLELISPVELSPLVTALQPIVILHSTDLPPFVTNLEIELSLDFDRTLETLVDRVERLDPQDRKRWDQCSSRRFNVGLQSGLEPHASEFVLPTAMIHRLANIDAEIVVTLYGARYEVAG